MLKVGDLRQQVFLGNDLGAEGSSVDEAVQDKMLDRWVVALEHLSDGVLFGVLLLENPFDVP